LDDYEPETDKIKPVIQHTASPYCKKIGKKKKVLFYYGRTKDCSKNKFAL